MRSRRDRPDGSDGMLPSGSNNWLEDKEIININKESTKAAFLSTFMLKTVLFSLFNNKDEPLCLQA